ncbi:MAG: hypothetical protein E6I08_03405 [Chloroflexi bacterium]|nr:MAG: hypothetical protein E6I08_03405 [Chloroflexota bacterium]
MNRWFDELGARLAAVATRRGYKIEPPRLDAEVAGELLELARVAAHTQERRFAPLASFLAGVAAERVRTAGGDASGPRLAALVREVREELEAEAPPSSA